MSEPRLLECSTIRVDHTAKVVYLDDESFPFQLDVFGPKVVDADLLPDGVRAVVLPVIVYADELIEE